MINITKFRPGNGIARQYRNANVARCAGKSSALGWGTISVCNALQLAIEKKPLSGVLAMMAAYLSQQGFEAAQSAKKVMKTLEPEYQKILKRAEAIKKVAIK